MGSGNEGWLFFYEDWGLGTAQLLDLDWRKRRYSAPWVKYVQRLGRGICGYMVRVDGILMQVCCRDIQVRCSIGPAFDRLFGTYLVPDNISSELKKIISNTGVPFRVIISTS
jgi:hypothetical protein